MFLFNFIDLIILAAVVDEDIREFITAYKKMIDKKMTFFEAVDGVRVLSSFIIVSSLTCKVKFIT